MSDPGFPALPLAHARRRFFAEGRDPGDAIAAHIHRSWTRCRTLALHDGDTPPLDRAQLGERREQAMRLLECARPELDSLSEHALAHGCAVLLSDASGLILDEIGSVDFLPKAQRLALTPGVDWSEGTRGTNAIGTALMEREPLMVLGAEHALPRNGLLGCAAAPIFNGRGGIAGVLDLSGEASQINVHALGLVRMAARQVEHRLLWAGARGRLLRFHRRPGLLGSASEGLVVIEEGRVVAANRVALALLGLGWDALLDQPAERWFGRAWAQAPGGRGLLTLPDGCQIAAATERLAAEGARRWPSGQAGSLSNEHRPGEDEAADALAAPLERARRVMDQGLPVLVTGETGSGKEVFARRLHAAGRRRGGPFVAVNCAALPDTLIEAELFGYEEGAYTGARRRGMPGRVREADGGILFLDEIGDMPALLQTRLLRVLEERAVTPLGGGRRIAVDFDLVCATHRDLDAMVADGRFRADLLYRIDGWRVTLPPLRARRLRVTVGDAIAIGPGKIALLEAIAATGSLTEAARHLGMSYRRAWLLLDQINRSLKLPAVDSAKGGAHGGGSVLTAVGEEVVTLYRGIEATAEAACADALKRLLALVAR
ncbi:sigma 54-interacting transcriptional regulator [Piscinibacter sakaiensis]|uniref:sigma 54-interacting transcriptional regulator n=1 Tax=Piscinibacter sakaiensis TaxID=1547922 RepID=UPI003729D966